MKLQRRKPLRIVLPEIEEEPDVILAPPRAKRKKVLFVKSRPFERHRPQSFFRPMSEISIIVPWEEIDDEAMYVLLTSSLAYGNKHKVFEGYALKYVTPESLDIVIEDIADDAVEAREAAHKGSNYLMFKVGEERYAWGQEVDRKKYANKSAAWLNSNLLGWQ